MILTLNEIRLYRFSGMTAAIQLQKKFGIQARIFEWGTDVGGTWLANTYPGCACDIPSGLYSFSFEPNPGKLISVVRTPYQHILILLESWCWYLI
jgi:cation diffusion facilitator CzcD-associated flavoprotein CzcO